MLNILIKSDADKVTSDIVVVGSNTAGITNKHILFPRLL